MRTEFSSIDDFIMYVNRELSFMEVLEKLNLLSSSYYLYDNGKQIKIICPFHDDTDPSMSISLEKNIYHCFGCGASGNLYTFVRKYLNHEHYMFTILWFMHEIMHVDTIIINGFQVDAFKVGLMPIKLDELVKYGQISIRKYPHVLRKIADYFQLTGSEIMDFIDRYRIGFLGEDVYPFIFSITYNYYYGDTGRRFYIDDFAVNNYLIIPTIHSNNEHVLTYVLRKIDGPDNLPKYIHHSSKSFLCNHYFGGHGFHTLSRPLKYPTLDNILFDIKEIQPEIIIFEGVMDLMYFEYKLGFEDIGLFTMLSSNVINDTILEMLTSKYRIFAIVYDLDESGKEGSKKLTEYLVNKKCLVYNIDYDNLPDLLTIRSFDILDKLYFKLYGVSSFYKKGKLAEYQFLKDKIMSKIQLNVKRKKKWTEKKF